ncbi:NAD-dependent epimerase/dehydratase family protein [Candidatus Dojkabacteria bacterium]|nr:NAD-dependent epimerase/dehydratase family protein [Candidatus Dojkabacteria bacterium]
MRILITGATGRVGRKLVRKLFEKHEVVITSSQENPFTNLKNILYIKADLTIVQEVENLLKEVKPEVVIHLAGVMGQVCEDYHKLAEKVNVEATKMLGSFAIQCGVKKFIFSSSAAVYPRNSIDPLHEKDVGPYSYYGKSKLKAEKELEEIASKGSMQVIVLRLFNIYGESFQDSLVTKLQNSQKESNPIPLYNPERFIRDYIHIDDVVRAFELALFYDLEKQFSVFNIGSGLGLSTSNLLSLFRKEGINPNVRVIQSNLDSTNIVANIDSTSKFLKFGTRRKIKDFISP